MKKRREEEGEELDTYRNPTSKLPNSAGDGADCTPVSISLTQALRWQTELAVQLSARRGPFQWLRLRGSEFWCALAQLQGKARAFSAQDSGGTPLRRRQRGRCSSHQPVRLLLVRIHMIGFAILRLSVIEQVILFVCSYQIHSLISLGQIAIVSVMSANMITVARYIAELFASITRR